MWVFSWDDKVESQLKIDMIHHINGLTRKSHHHINRWKKAQQISTCIYDKKSHQTRNRKELLQTNRGIHKSTCIIPHGENEDPPLMQTGEDVLLTTLTRQCS